MPVSIEVSGLKSTRAIWSETSACWEKNGGKCPKQTPARSNPLFQIAVRVNEAGCERPVAARRRISRGRERVALPQTTKSLAGTGSPRETWAMLANMRDTVGAKLSAAIAARCGVTTRLSSVSRSLSGGSGSTE